MGSACSKSKTTPATKPPATSIIIKSETAKKSMAPIAKTLALGAGCYWGTEKYIVKDFQKTHPGVIANAKVGFMNPNPGGMKNPSYRQVCSGSTGHVEVLNIELTDKAASTPEVFEDLMRFFYQFHDPTTLNRQGNDRGTQYGSVVFCSSPEQSEIAESIKAELQGHVDAKNIKTYQNKRVETKIVDYTTFYEAHEEHQEYLFKNPSGYCNHRYRFKEWPNAEL